jgi:hypothetical protein
VRKARLPVGNRLHPERAVIGEPDRLTRRFFALSFLRKIQSSLSGAQAWVRPVRVKGVEYPAAFSLSTTGRTCR